MSAGVLALVVGPSGAGKDSLIASARTQLAGDGRFVFPRRIVTRDSSVWEDHDSIAPADFQAKAAAGGFALHWRAHGLAYGLPLGVDEAIAAGNVAVCNVSRAAIEGARQRYARVFVIYVDAKPEIRARRIAARGREAVAGSRVEAGRNDTVHPRCDLLIDNSGALEPAVTAFVKGLLALAVTRSGEA